LTISPTAPMTPGSPTRRQADPAMLWLVHRDGAGSARERDSFRVEVGGRGLVLETCLRRLAVGSGTPPPLTGELLTGCDAYARLLEIVAGLRSAVPGETNVAGQFRRAWQDASGSAAAADGTARLDADVQARLAPVIAALLDDAASVRREHLQGIGGSSWGTLVRRLLKPATGARVLLIGAGDLAASIAPYLGRVSLGLWNRRPVDAPVRPALGAVGNWFDAPAADTAAHWAELVIFATPADVAHDTAWLTRFASRAAPLVGGAHLGQRDPTAFRWPEGTPGYLLDDVLALARTQQSRRQQAVTAARRHCAGFAARRFAADGTAPVPAGGLRALA
jgi:hypothetical protein